MTEEKIKFSELCNFTEKQNIAWRMLMMYKYVLFGGAMGGGKSYWLRWSLIKLLLKHAKDGHENVVVGLFCEDYPALKDRHLSKIGKEFPSWLGTFHSDHREYGKCFLLSPEYGGGILCFRNLDDPSKYASAEFADIGIDELTKNKQEVFDDLRTRLRWPGIDDPKFLAGTNPGGIGHVWVKKKWMDGLHETNEKEADKFFYIQSKAQDNPYLSPEYIDTLSGLPDDKRKAYLEGDWNIFKGQFFSEFRTDTHVVEPFTILPHWTLFICGDYGYAKPSAIYWCAVDEYGTVYFYRELYKTKLTYARLCQAIIEMTPSDEIDRIKRWVFDPAIWAKKGETDLSGAEIIRDQYFETTGKGLNLVKGNNDRINGWNVMREYLKPRLVNGENVPKLQIFKTCPDLIRTLPALIYDDFKVEDCDTDGEDHGPDAGRYGLMDRPQSAIKDVGYGIKMLNKPINPQHNDTSYE